MRLAVTICRNPSCKQAYDAEVKEMRHIKCPYCHQNNEIDAISGEITGRCQRCNKAWDDHDRKGTCP